MKLSFTKAHATGNDFVIVYKEHNPNIVLTPNMVRFLCDRKYGVGSDGLLVIDNVVGYDFKLDYYNNDGSWETLCANGIRCAALFMFTNAFIKNNATVMCGDGPHDIKLEKNMVTTSMKVPKYKSKVLTVNGYSGRYVDSGAKHFVVLVDNIDDINVDSEGKKIRNSNLFSPEGINVNFYSVNNNCMHVRTYEKGIESEMLSCGSGSVACAYDAFNKGLVSSKVLINVKGGELALIANYASSNVWLSGLATLVYNSDIKYKEENG